jgi:hypothetical protein
MGYLIRPSTTSPRTAHIPPRNPFGDGNGNPPVNGRFHASRHAKTRANTRAGLSGYSPTRVRVANDQLGVVPLIAAAVPSVKDLAAKAFTSLVAIFDPGKKRDAVREGQAEAFYQWAVAGSLTAARTLHGGTRIPYTVKEKGFYQTRWNKLQASNATLAAQAVAAGDLAPIDAGQSTTAIQFPPSLLDTVQNEINIAHGVASASSPIAGGVAKAGVNPIVGLAILGAFLARKMF